MLANAATAAARRGRRDVPKRDELRVLVDAVTRYLITQDARENIVGIVSHASPLPPGGLPG